MSEMPVPICLAMVICDHVHREPGGGKYTLLGLFSDITAKGFPVVHPRLSVFIELTDGYGKMPVRLRMIDVDERREPVFEAIGEIEFADPRTVASLEFHFHNSRFTEPGEHRLQLFCAGHPIMERRIMVRTFGQP
jgi:hypothetical protein